MDCVNPNTPEFREMLFKMGGNPLLAEIEMNKVQEELLVKPGVEELFNSTPELANQVYEALGFNQLITPNDKIVFGHPGIGKTFAKKSNDFIDVDEDYKEEHTMQKILRAKAKNTGKKEDLKEWEDYVTAWWNKVKNDAKKSGKTIFVSNLPILRMFPQDFDKVIDISKDTFINRAKQRNDYKQGETEEWKDSLDIEIAKIDKSKVVTTDKYLSDLFVTPQQKQQALQLYSQYLDTIFPDSVVKDVVYHGTSRSEKSFEKRVPLDAYGSNAIYFANESYAKTFGNLIPALLDIRNPFTSELKFMRRRLKPGWTSPSGTVDARALLNTKKNNDGLIGVDYSEQENNTYVVRESEQIHILGNKQDIEGFREFVQMFQPEVLIENDTDESYWKNLYTDRRLSNAEDFKSIPIPGIKNKFSPDLYNVYHGTDKYEIDGEGNLILTPSKNFEDRTTSMSFTQVPVVAQDYMLRKNGNIIIKINNSAIGDNYDVESAEEIAINGNKPFVVPKGQYEIITVPTLAEKMRQKYTELVDDIVEQRMYEAKSDIDLLDSVYSDRIEAENYAEFQEFEGGGENDTIPDWYVPDEYLSSRAAKKIFNKIKNKIDKSFIINGLSEIILEQVRNTGEKFDINERSLLNLSTYGGIYSPHTGDLFSSLLDEINATKAEKQSIIEGIRDIVNDNQQFAIDFYNSPEQVQKREEESRLFQEKLRESSDIFTDEIPFQLKGETESSRASNQTIALIKDFLSRIGVDIKNVDEIVVNGVKMDANAAALIAQKLVLLTEGKEGIALTEEAMHFAVEIIEQKDPKLFNQLLKEINSYRLLTTVINDYGKLPMYQTSDGKPDIRKLKKEAIAKVLTEVIINKNEGITEKPELLAKVETWWQRIINALKGLFSTSGFDRAAMMVLKGEAIGTVDDIRLRNDVFLQENITPQQRIVNQFRMVSASIKKPVNEGDKYEINGKKIRTRVTDISKTWLDNLFAERKLTEDEFDKAVNNIYSQSGSGLHNDIHKMLVGTLLDDDGKFIKDPTQRKSDDNYVSQLSPLNKKFYDLLKEHMEKRLATFPDNTTFLSEITIYDPKRDLAGTVDFIAVEPSGKTHILDWKFIKINNVEYQEDIPWYSVGYWRRQMKNYKLILSNAYGIDFDGTEQTRMIPFRAIYSKMDKKKGIKPQLLDLEVGSVDPKIEERAYLVPVGLEEERTGEKRIDALIDQLNQVYDLISERKVTAETKKEKAEQLNELYKAIRQLKMRSNLSPLINQAGVLNKAVEGLITEYYNNWEGKDISEFSQAERNDFASRINDFENSLFVYTNLYKNLRPLFQGELSEKDKKIKDELRDVTEDANELQISLEEVRNKLAEKIASSANIIDYLRPEKVIKGFSSWFGTTSTLQNKSAQILYKMANRAFGLAAMETQSEGSILIDIKKRYDQWAKSKGLTNKNYFDIIKKKPGDNKEAIEQKRKDALKNLLDQKDFYTDEEYKAQERKVHEKYDKELKGKNELIDEYDYKFYSELRKKSQDKDFEWIKENIDVEAYKKHIAEKRETEIERAKNKVRYGSDFARQRQLNEDISKIESLYDVASSEGLGWLLYDETRKFPKEKWISEQWKELYKKDGAGNYVNAPAVELFEYIRSRNDFFEEIGYINPKQERTFLPFVRKGLVEKLVMGGDVTLFEGALRSITVTEGDVGYGQIDPITKKPVYTIPRYFTRDTGEEMSDDLFKNMTIVNEAAIRYRYLTEMEKQMHLIINTESNKNAIKTSYFGKTKLNADGEPEITNDNTENTQLVRDMMEAIVYGHKFVESQNFDQLLFGLGKMGKKFNEKLGMKIFPEEFDDSKISLNKSINWLNNAFQLKALGLNPLSALATLLGGSFQSTINAGKYFTKSEFAKNQFLLASRMNGVDAKKYMGALEYFLPLTENYNMIIAKKLSLSKFSQEGIQDALMYLMRKADQYIQSVNFFSYLDNTIVMDGKLVNAREYLRTTPEYANIYSVSGDERKRMNDKFEEDVKKLLSEKGVMNVAVLEGDKFTIPGVERKSDTVISLRKVVQGITKDALGNLSEDDIRRINLNIYGKSFMVFKNWIPRLVDVRFGNLKYNSATDAYEWGRTRMLMRWLSEEKLRALDSLKSAMLGNDEKFVAQMRALYERKKMDYEKDTGKKLNMTEAEFIELAAQNVKNQMVDVLFYLALTGLVMAASGLKDDDDERAVKNRYNYMIRAIDKIRDEIAYFYNPTQLINLSKSGFFPAISMIENYEKTFRNFIKEMYAISVDDDKMAEKNYVIKYALKGLPVTSQFDAIFLIFFPDLAKDLGMRSQSESRPIGR
jgi:hypothetical protein